MEITRKFIERPLMRLWLHIRYCRQDHRRRVFPAQALHQKQLVWLHRSTFHIPLATALLLAR